MKDGVWNVEGQGEKRGDVGGDMPSEKTNVKQTCTKQSSNGGDKLCEHAREVSELIT